VSNKLGIKPVGLAQKKSMVIVMTDDKRVNWTDRFVEMNTLGSWVYSCSRRVSSQYASNHSSNDSSQRASKPRNYEEGQLPNHKGEIESVDGDIAKVEDPKKTNSKDEDGGNIQD
jgi:hypothetical protein